MDANVMMVAGIANIIASGYGNAYPYGSEEYINFTITNNKICNEIYYWNRDKLGCNKSINYIYECLKKYSLIELIEFMQILIPIASSNKDHNYILNITNTINVLNSSINNMTDDAKNFHDLIKVNQELKNKCEKLESELSAIKKIVGGS
jgi:hypothetical protein